MPLPPPLGEPRAFARTSVALTELGRDVLDAKADRVDVVGIDAWLGGTRLGSGPDWRWDAAAGSVRARG